VKIYGSDIANAISAMERAAQFIRESDKATSCSSITLRVDLEHGAQRLKSSLGLIDVEIKDDK
jgi:hypothetical protein